MRSSQMANITTFPTRGRTWSTSERLTLLEIHSALRELRPPMDCEHGISDEGDPWTVFYDRNHGSILAHVAREGSTYVLVWPDRTAVRTLDLSRFVDVARNGSLQAA